MYRAERIVIRLSKAERAVIERLAERERLPTSTMVRALLLKEVERREREEKGLGAPLGERAA